MAATPRPDSFELGDYLGVLRRRWWIVLLAVLIGAAGGAAYTKLAPKSYVGSVLIQVNQLPNNTNSATGRTSGQVNMDNQAQIVQSVTVASLAARQFSPGLSPVDLARRITVSVPPNTTFLQIKCTLPGPPAAAACANAFGQAYLTYGQTTAASAISGQIASQTRRISGLTARIATLKSQLTRSPRNSAQRVRDELSLNADQGLLSELTASNDKLVPLLASLNLPNNTAIGQIVTPATVPTSPSSPRALLVLPSGVLIGLLIGLLVAFARDFRHRRVYAARDVERFLDLPVLVDLAAGKARLPLALAPPRSRAGQAFTELGQYIAASLGDGSHVVFVAGTSAGPGCSLLAANLAATLARTRSEVVLVCADPHGTVTPQLLGISDGRGLAEVLAGTATTAEVARRVAQERRLRVITPGLDTSGILLHLQYDASRRLLGELRREVRYVIVEVQSLGEDSDAFALAEFADAAVMSIETSLTTRSGAAECLQRLDRLRTSVLGAVVLPAPGSRRPAGPPRSDSPAADSPRPDPVRADSARPDAVRPDTRRPESARPDSPRSDSPRSDSARPGSPRSDSARSDSARPGSPRSDSPRSDSARPGSPRSDSPRPDTRRPEGARPGGGAASSAAEEERPRPSSGGTPSLPETGRSARAWSARPRPEPTVPAAGGSADVGSNGSNGADQVGSSAGTGRPSSARPATESRPSASVKSSRPAGTLEDPVGLPARDPLGYPDPADKIAGA